MRGIEVPEIKKHSTAALDNFDKLANYIGRLGATRSSVDAMFKAMAEVPAVRRISCIERVKAANTQLVLLDEREMMSPYEILRGICLDSTSRNPLELRNVLRKFVEFDVPSTATAETLREVLNSRKVIHTRIHAELQIADKFSRSQNMRFANNDRYIGCSKPACYFCFNWLINHKHVYVPPASHTKVIPGCRGPDTDINATGVAILTEMYSKVCKQLGEDILDFLLGPAQTRFQHQSTEGSSHA